MSFTLVQKTQYATVVAGAPSQTFASPNGVGNLLIAFVSSTSAVIGPNSNGGASSGTSITDTAGNVWKQAGVYAVTGLTGIWYCESAKGGTPTVTWNLGSVTLTGATFRLSIAEYSGHLVSHPLSFAGGVAATAQPVGGAFTPAAGCLIVNEWSTNGPSVTWASPVNITLQTNTTDVMVWGDNQNSAAGDNRMGANVGASPDCIGSTAVFLPASYSPGTGFKLVRTTMSINSGAPSVPRFAGGNQAGNLIIVAIETCNSSASAISSVTDSAGNSYSLIASFHGVETLNDFISIYACQSCIGTTVDNTISVAYTATPSNSHIAMGMEFSGQLTAGGLLDVSATVSNNANLATNITAAAAGELLLQVASHGASGAGFSALGGSQTDLTYFAQEYSNYAATNQGTGIFGGNVNLYINFAIATLGSNALALTCSAPGVSLTVALKAAPIAPPSTGAFISQPISVVPVNASGHGLAITSPTVSGKMGQPIPIVFTDPNGNEYSVSGATVGAEIAGALPVVLCNTSGQPIIPPIVITSNGNSITVNSTLTGTKLGQPTPIVLTNGGGASIGLSGFSTTGFVANPTPATVTDANGNAVTLTVAT